jgi:hypothetical protein
MKHRLAQKQYFLEVDYLFDSAIDQSSDGFLKQGYFGRKSNSVQIMAGSKQIHAIDLI